MSQFSGKNLNVGMGSSVNKDVMGNLQTMGQLGMAQQAQKTAGGGAVKNPLMEEKAKQADHNRQLQRDRLQHQNAVQLNSEANSAQALRDKQAFDHQDNTAAVKAQIEQKVKQGQSELSAAENRQGQEIASIQREGGVVSAEILAAHEQELIDIQSELDASTIELTTIRGNNTDQSNRIFTHLGEGLNSHIQELETLEANTLTAIESQLGVAGQSMFTYGYEAFRGNIPGVGSRTQGGEEDFGFVSSLSRGAVNILGVSTLTDYIDENIAESIDPVTGRFRSHASYATLSNKEASEMTALRTMKHSVHDRDNYSGAQIMSALEGSNVIDPNMNPAEKAQVEAWIRGGDVEYVDAQGNVQKATAPKNLDAIKGIDQAMLGFALVSLDKTAKLRRTGLHEAIGQLPEGYEDWGGVTMQAETYQLNSYDAFDLASKGRALSKGKGSASFKGLHASLDKRTRTRDDFGDLVDSIQKGGLSEADIIGMLEDLKDDEYTDVDDTGGSTDRTFAGKDNIFNMDDLDSFFGEFEQIDSNTSEAITGAKDRTKQAEVLRSQSTADNARGTESAIQDILAATSQSSLDIAMARHNVGRSGTLSGSDQIQTKIDQLRRKAPTDAYAQAANASAIADLEAEMTDLLIEEELADEKTMEELKKKAQTP